MMIKGVIFDLDGLILDTERLYQRFWREAAQAHGFEMTVQTTLDLRSLDYRIAAGMLEDLYGDGFDFDAVRETRRIMMNAYVDEHGIQAKTGVRELTDYLKKQGILVAIATASSYERTDDYLKKAGVRDCFDTIVNACDLPRGKPFPDVYQYACKKLGLAPKECVALEDSPNGVKAAYAAGCRVICVPDGGDLEEEVKPFITASAKSLEEVIDIVDVINIMEATKKDRLHEFSIYWRDAWGSCSGGIVSILNIGEDRVWISFLVNGERFTMDIPDEDEFIEKLKEINIRALDEKEYTNSNVLDGHDWGVRISFDNNEIYSVGSNAYPPQFLALIELLHERGLPTAEYEKCVDESDRKMKGVTVAPRRKESFAGFWSLLKI